MCKKFKVFKTRKKWIFQKFAFGNIFCDCLLVSYDTGPYQSAFRRGVMLFLSPRLDMSCVRTNRVINKIPNYFFEKEPPIIGYRFNKSIAGKLFNYKQTLSEDMINDYDNNNIHCDCQNSRFKDGNHGHVITGDFDIIENECLRNIIKKGPKYRLPQKINWEKDRDIIEEFLETYTEKWINKERKNCRVPFGIECLDSWKDEVLEIVDGKIRAGKVRFGKTWTMRIEGALETELERLKEKYVITVTDKAQNNILFTCKYFYINKAVYTASLVACFWAGAVDPRLTPHMFVAPKTWLFLSTNMI